MRLVKASISLPFPLQAATCCDFAEFRQFKFAFSPFRLFALELNNFAAHPADARRWARKEVSRRQIPQNTGSTRTRSAAAPLRLMVSNCASHASDLTSLKLGRRTNQVFYLFIAWYHLPLPSFTRLVGVRSRKEVQVLSQGTCG